MRTPAQALAYAKTFDTYQTGMCLRWVRQLYGVGARHPTAAVAWTATTKRYTSTPPRGVPVWWTVDQGHVAISDGNGYVISTDYPSRGRVGRVSIAVLTSAWGKTYRGWSEDINGVDIFPGSPAAPGAYKPPAFPTGIGPGRRDPSAVTLQRVLKVLGFMPAKVVENANYGPQTQAAVARFHNRYPQFRSIGVVRDTRIGPKGWAFLFTQAYGK